MTKVVDIFFSFKIKRALGVGISQRRQRLIDDDDDVEDYYFYQRV